jgi:hypothetical protein
MLFLKPDRFIIKGIILINNETVELTKTILKNYNNIFCHQKSVSIYIIKHFTSMNN